MTPHYSEGAWNKRRAVFLESDTLKLGVLPGGGHIASLTLKEGPGANINPLWTVPWDSMDPKDFKESDQSRYGGIPEGRLLASIMGHNLCFDFFGGPSPEEQAKGVSAHGEAPVLMWDVVESKPAGASSNGLECSVKLPHAQLMFRRSIRMNAGQSVVRFDNEAENLSADPRDIGWQEHVTIGPGFLEKGVTLFDASATWGQVFPAEFSKRERLKRGAEFEWPMAPGADGSAIDLRVYPKMENTSDFSAQLMDPKREWAWFTAVNPKQGLLFGYLWRRNDFPWLGNWEENHCRLTTPWNGRALTRGMEFGVSPFPISREAMRALGQVHGTPTLHHLPGKGKWNTRFYAFLAPVAPACEGVEAVSFEKGSIVICQRNSGKKIGLKAE